MCWHRWTMWDLETQSSIFNERNEIIGALVIQSRRCTKCGKRQFDKERIGL